MTQETEHQHAPAPVEVVPQIQGMHCILKGYGTIRATVTMSDVSLTIYETANLLEFTIADVRKRFKKLAMTARTNIVQSKLEQDFEDLITVCSKVQKTNMCLRSGDRISTYALGQPVYDEKDGFLFLSPSMKQWWTHPSVEPIVQSIQEYLPGFAPWLLQKDIYIGILSQKSSLL